MPDRPKSVLQASATGWLSPSGSPAIECVGNTFISFKGTFPMPDPDINGIGVVMSFIIATYTSFLLGVAFYLLGCVPAQNLSTFERQYIKPKVTLRRVQDFLNGVSIINEQQMITALGVLGAALKDMRKSTVFDFQTKIYLAWMATNMHLSTLSILRPSFWVRPWLRAFKLLHIWVLLIMMCIVIYPTTGYKWAGATVRAKGFCSSADSCFGLEEKVEFHWPLSSHKQGSYKLIPQGVFAYAILIISHLWQSVMLFPKTHGAINHRFHLLLRYLEKRMADANRGAQKPIHKIVYRSIIGTYMFVLAFIEVTGSWAFSQFLIGVHLAWSSFQLFLPRFIYLPSCVADYLNEMNFGQILPMMLLLAPVYSILTYYLRYIQPSGSNISATTAMATTTTNPSSASSQSAQNRPPTSITTPSLSTVLDNVNASTSNAHESVRAYFFTTVQFKLIVFAQCFIAFASVVGYFVSTAIALHIYDDTTTFSQKWYEISYKTWPTIIASSCAFVLLFFISFTSAFFKLG